MAFGDEIVFQWCANVRALSFCDVFGARQDEHASAKMVDNDFIRALCIDGLAWTEPRRRDPPNERGVGLAGQSPGDAV